MMNTPLSDPGVSACPIFQGFTVEEYEPVLGLLDQETYAKGDVILHEGKSKQALWIVIKGSCVVVKMNKNKTEKELATLEAGAVFGEMSFFKEAPHSATVRALSVVKVMRLSRENYEQLHTRSPSAAFKIASAVASLMAQRLRRMDDWICNFIDTPDGASHREEWHDFRSKLYADWQF
jgi:CRP/FNR family transcriptional regulator, cyclic AMP receptor protein